jgi:hypothetical protein
MSALTPLDNSTAGKNRASRTVKRTVGSCTAAAATDLLTLTSGTLDGLQNGDVVRIAGAGCGLTPPLHAEIGTRACTARGRRTWTITSPGRPTAPPHEELSLLATWLETSLAVVVAHMDDARVLEKIRKLREDTQGRTPAEIATAQ